MTNPAETISARRLQCRVKVGLVQLLAEVAEGVAYVDGVRVNQPNMVTADEKAAA